MSLPILTEPDEQELAILREDAKTADGCLDWHKHCAAECCKQFSLKDDPKYDLSEKYIRMFGNALPDLIWYYELHGCKYRTPHLYIPTRNARRHNGRIFFLERCKFLTDDMKCKGHPNRKPKVCRDFNPENIREHKERAGSTMTPRCLFRFKLEETP